MLKLFSVKPEQSCFHDPSTFQNQFWINIKQRKVLKLSNGKELLVNLDMETSGAKHQKQFPMPQDFRPEPETEKVVDDYIKGMNTKSSTRHPTDLEEAKKSSRPRRAVW